MRPDEAYAWLLSHSQETAYLESMRSLLFWDQRTHIPVRGHAHRAAQLASLAKFLHQRVTDPRIGDMLAVLEESDVVREGLSAPAVNVREWRRAFDRASKIPERLAVELAQAAADGQTAWENARRENDWSSFKPYLERIIILRREEAEALGYDQEPYDALLDDFEPDARAGQLEAVFSTLRKALTTLLQGIESSSMRPDTSVLRFHCSRSSQEAFAGVVVARLGYDLDAGRIDATAHPFTVGIGPGDVRITTRYDEKQFSVAFFGAVHEAGHAIYDQGLPADHWGTPMGGAVSLAVHESQSRLWENMVCRSLGFWKHFYPEAQKTFPGLKGTPLEAFHFAVNKVCSSLIRTEADEVTYNLHVLLRFELELAIMRRELEVSDLPGAWDEKMRAYLGITPPDAASGVLQDIHWSAGMIGYFPTYTLGNLYAAQFFARGEQDLGGLDVMFSRGEFAPLLEWLRTKIHSQGSRYRSPELLRQVTGEEMNPAYLVSYLAHKYGALYRFEYGVD